MKPPSNPAKPEPAASSAPAAEVGSSGDEDKSPTTEVREIGGRRDGTDPTRFGDWEKGGRCIDF